jgi:hypothetical protein
MAQNQKKSEPIPLDVFNRLTKKNGWTTNFFYLMKELHLSDEQLLEMPLPRLMALMAELKEHGEREEKALKKSRKK